MIGIINYGAGNLFSLQCALDRIGVQWQMVQGVEEYGRFDRYIIPGVGHAKPAMEKLTATGLVPLIKSTKKPVLGVCLGMQLMTEWSEEGDTKLLGLIPLKTKRFTAPKLKIPQMGWNQVFSEGSHPLMKGIAQGEYFYFVHSYFVEYSAENTIAFSEYGEKFSACITKDNFMGVQFHPEKSGRAGEEVLRNFSRL